MSYGTLRPSARLARTLCGRASPWARERWVMRALEGGPRQARFVAGWASCRLVLALPAECLVDRRACARALPRPAAHPRSARSLQGFSTQHAADTIFALSTAPGRSGVAGKWKARL
jgi:hypothetical protein